MEYPPSNSIFLVDDNPLCLMIYKKYLQGIGYHNIRCFESGPQCITYIDEQPGIVFLDYYMPPMNGLDTLKKIKSLYPGICIVMLSAQEDTDVAVHALKCGAYDYIVKGKNELTRIQDVMQRFMMLKNVIKQQPTQTTELQSFNAGNRWYSHPFSSTLAQ